MKKKVFLTGVGIFLLLSVFLSEAEAGVQSFEEPKENQIENIDFENGDFEDPKVYEVIIPGAYFDTIAGVLKAGYNGLPMAEVPGWSTRVVDPKDASNPRAEFIELILHGFQSTPANDGRQYAELNAIVPGTLFQTVDTTPEQKVYWEFYHRGRLGTDTMEFFLNDVSITVATTGNTSWRRYYGVYIIPDGQTKTEFAFTSVSAAGGSLAAGNFLDSIRLFYPAFLEIEKTVVTPGQDSQGSYALIGDRITYQMNITNTGEAESSRTMLTDILPDSLTYVPDSVKMSYTDADGNYQEIDPTGLVAFDPSQDLLTIETGIEISGAKITDSNGNEVNNTIANGTRSIEKGASVTVSFEAEVTGSGVAPGDEIENQVRVSYNDLGFEQFNVNSSGEIQDQYNVSNRAGFILRDHVSIDIEKLLEDTDKLDQSFLFRIDYCPDEQAVVEKTYYADAMILAEGLTAVTEMERLRPGYYFVTEVDSSWIYTIKNPAEQTQKIYLNGLDEQYHKFTYENQKEERAWIRGKGRVENKMG